MGVTWTAPETAATWVRQVRAQTGGPFQVNFVLEFEPRGLEAVLDAGVPMVTFSWGDPGNLARLVKAAGAFLGIQVVSASEAEESLRHDPNFLICQGIEAGGHVQSDTPLDELLSQVVAVARGVPIIAAGGIATRAQVQSALSNGATGAMLGTRFVASQESRAHADYKRLLVERSETSMTRCFDIGWKNAKHRVLPNETLIAWRAAGEPSEPNRPGEGDILANSAGIPIYRYEDTAPRLGMDGDIEAMCLYAGTGVRKIHDVPTAAEIIKRLCPE